MAVAARGGSPLRAPDRHRRQALQLDQREDQRTGHRWQVRSPCAESARVVALPRVCICLVDDLIVLVVLLT